MNKVITARGLTSLAVLVFLLSPFSVNAAEREPFIEEAIYVDVTENSESDKAKYPDEYEIKFFETKYKVSVTSVIMRSGPGYSYSAEGTLYKNDIVYVKSISSGWAKFKVSGEWRYVPESALIKL